MDGVLTDSSNLDLERYPWTIQMALVFLSYRLDFFFLGWGHGFVGIAGTNTFGTGSLFFSISNEFGGRY